MDEVLAVHQADTDYFDQPESDTEAAIPFLPPRTRSGHSRLERSCTD